MKTSIKNKKIVKFIERTINILLKEKRHKKESYGSKDQLIINKMFMENCRSKREKDSYG